MHGPLKVKLNKIPVINTAHAQLPVTYLTINLHDTGKIESFADTFRNPDPRSHDAYLFHLLNHIF